MIRSPRGFTLVEIILAIALAMLLFGGLFAFYHHTSDARRRLMDRMQQHTARQLVMQRITDELRCATTGLQGQALNGAAGQLSFACATAPGGGVWAVIDPTDAPATPQHDVMLVIYRLRYEEDESTGEPYIVGLERVEQRYVPPPTVDVELARTAALLDTDIRFIRLRYWSGDQWLAQWSGGDLPGAVEITLGERALPEGIEPIDYPYPTMRRVVALPTSSPGTGGGARLGLAAGVER